jgi:hypothetical protein
LTDGPAASVTDALVDNYVSPASICSPRSARAILTGHHHAKIRSRQLANALHLR